MADMIRILIADDHAVVRRGLKQIIDEQPDMRVQGEAPDAAAALRLVRQQEWDVVLLDLDMPGRGGLEVLQDLHDVRPRLPVLILSVHPEEQFGVRVLKAGAAGYLSKTSDPDELVRAIRKAYAGGNYVSPAVAEQLARAVRDNSDQPPHTRLSDREYQILRLIASGKTVSAIADELALSVKTISTYRARVLEKMGLKTNAELTHYAIRNGLVG
jgi:DNA-binding NarL/FixJ family response regulator